MFSISAASTKFDSVSDCSSGNDGILRFDVFQRLIKRYALY